MTEASRRSTAPLLPVKHGRLPSVTAVSNVVVVDFGQLELIGIELIGLIGSPRQEPGG